MRYRDFRVIRGRGSKRGGFRFGWGGGRWAEMVDRWLMLWRCGSRQGEIFVAVCCRGLLFQSEEGSKRPRPQQVSGDSRGS